MERKLKENIELSYLGFKKEPMDKYYESFFGVFSRLRVKKIIEELNIPLDGHVLDVGCEAGWLSLRLVNAGLKIIPFDICKPAIIDFKQKLLHEVGRSNVIGPFLGTVYKIPIKSNSVNYVVCSEVIQLTPFVHLIIYEITRILKKSGKLILTFPNEKFKKKLYPIAKILGVNVEVQDKVTPYQYSLKEVERTVKKYFKIQKSYGFPSSLLPITNIVVCQKR